MVNNNLLVLIYMNIYVFPSIFLSMSIALASVACDHRRSKTYYYESLGDKPFYMYPCDSKVDFMVSI